MIFYCLVSVLIGIKRNVLGYKAVIRNCKTKKDKPYNGQKKKDKRTNNDLQNTTQKIKDRAIQIPIKTGSAARG